MAGTAAALVGVKGAYATAAAATISPAFGQATIVNHLLTCNVVAIGGSALPTTGQAGWVQAGTGANSGTVYAAIWYKPNCAAGETAPTFTATGATYMRAELAEWSGVVDSSPVEAHSSPNGTTSPLNAVVGATVNTGNLLLLSEGWLHSGAVAPTLSDSAPPNPNPTLLGSDAATSQTTHSRFAYCITNNPLSSLASATDNGAGLTNGAMQAVSFQVRPPQQYVYKPVLFGPPIKGAPWNRVRTPQRPLPNKVGIQIFFVSVADDLSAFSESTTRSAMSFVRTGADAFSALTDTAVKTAQAFARAGTDTFSALTDSVSRSAMSFVRTGTDAFSALTDAAVKTAQVFTRTGSDVFGAISDSASRSTLSFTRTGADAMAFTDSAVRSVLTFVRTLADTVGFSETATRIVRFPRTVADSAVFSEVATRASQVYNRAASDTQAFTESASRSAMSFIRAIGDSPTFVGDLASRALLLPRAAADAMGLTELASRAVMTFTRTGADSFSFSEATTSFKRMFVGASDSFGTFMDSTVINRVLVGFVSTIPLLVAQGRRFVVATQARVLSLPTKARAVSLEVQKRSLNLLTKYRPTSVEVQLRTLALKAQARPLTLVGNLVGGNSQVSQTDLQPFDIEVNTTETVTYTVDMTQYLSGTETVNNAVQSLKTWGNGITVAGAFSGSPVISGNLVQVKIVGSVLQPGQQYRLIVTFDAKTGGTVDSTLSGTARVTCNY